VNEAEIPGFLGDFWPPETRKVMGLMGKSKAFALNVVGNPIWQKIGEYFLTSKLQHNWVSLILIELGHTQI